MKALLVYLVLLAGAAFWIVTGAADHLEQRLEQQRQHHHQHQQQGSIQ